jgi:hypothetical protein
MCAPSVAWTRRGASLFPDGGLGSSLNCLGPADLDEEFEIRLREAVGLAPYAAGRELICVPVTNAK